MISKILQILGLQPRISRVFLNHKNNFVSQLVRTILVTKYHLEHLLRKPSGCDFQELLPKDYKLLQINKLINSWPGVIWDHLTLLKWVEKINQKTFHTIQWCQSRAERETTRFLGGFYQLPPNPSGWDSNLSSCLITLGKNGQFLFDWSILWVKKPFKRILRYLHHVTKKYENKFS